MSRPILTVENLSKAYRIGLKEEIPDTFFSAATGWMTTPLRNWRRLRRLNTFQSSAVSGQQSAISGNGAGSNGQHAPNNGQPPTDEPDIIWALKDVSFDVAEGEVVGIIGRNGAGKSTLLKILSRITEPTSGEARLRGRVSSLLEVGTGFHPELTGRENIYMNGTILGMSKREIDRKFDEIVDFSGVERFLDTPVKRYSSGMSVRLAFSVAAHLEPEILIIDEVLAVGDLGFQKRCLGKMEDVARGGRTVLFVSHNLGVVSSLCSRAVLLENGEMVHDGRSQDTVREYLCDEEEKASVDLTQHHLERRGAGQMRFEYATTIDSAGAICGRFAFHQPITFRFGIRGIPGTECIVGINVFNSQGQHVLHPNNIDESVSIVLSAELTEVSVTIRDHRLNDDRYGVMLWLGDDLNVLHDEVKEALSFVVESAEHGHIRCRAALRVASSWCVRSQLGA